MVVTSEALEQNHKISYQFQSGANCSIRTFEKKNIRAVERSIGTALMETERCGRNTRDLV